MKLSGIIKGRYQGNGLLPAATPLIDLWKGSVHMHTAFWMAWVVPLALYAIVEPWLPWIAELLFMPYILFSAIGAWRSTKNPPGKPWAAYIYRILLVIFGFSVAVPLAGYAYVFFWK